MNLKAKILVNSSVYRSRNKRNGGHQTLLLGVSAKQTQDIQKNGRNRLKSWRIRGRKYSGIPFLKPWRDLAKCKRWIVACSREFFTEKKVNKNTYICALHWPGGKGPTVEFPDPLKANLTPTQAGRASAPKRKAPKSREEPVTKQKKVINENYGEQSDEFLEFIPTDDQELLESSKTDAINFSSQDSYSFSCPYSENILHLCTVLPAPVCIFEHSQGQKTKQLHDYSDLKTKADKVHTRREEQRHCSQISQQ